MTVNLYVESGAPFPNGTRTKIATSGEINIPDQVDSIFTVPLIATVPAGTLELVMEVTTPDGTAVGNLFFIGSNPDPQTGLSYLSANDCGVPRSDPYRRSRLPGHAHCVEREWQLPRGRKPNANANAYGNANANAYGNDHTTSISYANNHAEANTDAKAAAYAISSSDAVSEWAKRFKIVTK